MLANIRTEPRGRWESQGREVGISMRMLAHPARKDIELTAVFHALSDPVRLSIVTDLLDGGEAATGDLAIPIHKSSLSHHLKILREAGVTFTRIEGTHRFLSLRREDLEARFPGLLAAVAAAASSRVRSRVS